MLTTLEELQDDTAYFVLICSTRRRRAYQEVLDESQQAIVVVDTPEEALRQVVRRPPIAVIVDMITGMRAGASTRAYWFSTILNSPGPSFEERQNKTNPFPLLLLHPQRTAAPLSRRSTVWSRH